MIVERSSRQRLECGPPRRSRRVVVAERGHPNKSGDGKTGGGHPETLFGRTPRRCGQEGPAFEGEDRGPVDSGVPRPPGRLEGLNGSILGRRSVHAASGVATRSGRGGNPRNSATIMSSIGFDFDVPQKSASFFKPACVVAGRVVEPGVGDGAPTTASPDGGRGGDPRERRREREGLRLGDVRRRVGREQAESAGPRRRLDFPGRRSGPGASGPMASACRAPGQSQDRAHRHPHRAPRRRRAPGPRRRRAEPVRMVRHAGGPAVVVIPGAGGPPPRETAECPRRILGPSGRTRRTASNCPR